MKSGNVFYTRSNGGQWISYQEAVFEDETLTSTLISNGIQQEASKIISDFLIKRSINVVQLPSSILKGFPNEERERQQVTPKLVRDNIRHTTKALVEKMDKSVFTVFFEYLLSDKIFAELRGCTILPLMNKSFGTLGKERSQFYIANEVVIALFPDLSSSFVDLKRISELIINALTTTEATESLNVKRLDNDAFIQLLSEMLRPGDHLDYDRNGTSINDKWLHNLWCYLDATENIEMTAFESMPILPTVGPNGMLVSLNQKLPLLYQNSSRSNINAILTKIGTHLVDKRYSKRLSGFVLEFSVTNVLKCIQLASTKANCSIEELLLPLSPDERNILRTFFQGNEYDLFQNERSSESIEILRQLPIFPAHTSSSTVAFKPATDCRLLPQNFPVFSVPSGKAILCKNDTNHNFAVKINIPELSVQEHLRYNVLPLLNNPLPGQRIPDVPSQGSQLRRGIAKVAKALPNAHTASAHPERRVA
ncbi:LOW QUALITY PROTEIN: hypothetical protein BC938DRAFT_474973 [Jimgerdemannia flammicorona]|uniref:Uncharacterized protein n=1 Tax=Jimgerdemannia flammicorona TaxID=994334 RepID=A0A433QS65_9FUNG|nr:LOW QUALITY PROTEIN: hypothetical protein BC938DRAFT_474973 [Jimgerdemannia flammicorona]